MAIILIFAIAAPLLTACAKTPETTSSSSSEPRKVEKLTADEYFATPIEFEGDTTSYEYFYYPENASKSDPVVFEVTTVDENWRINGSVPNPYGLALYGDKLEIIEGDKTRVIYEGDITPFLMSLSQRKEEGFNSDIRLFNDVLVFPAVTDDGYEIRYAYIYDGECRLAAKTTDRPDGVCAVSNHEFVWSIDNEEYERVYLEKKENHPKEQDYIFESDFETFVGEMDKRWDFEEIYKVYPYKYYYIDVVSGYTFFVDSGSTSEMVLFDPIYSRWWLDYLPEE